MALISSKNLVAPLTNKIHITTIILIAMVFAVFRFAGGGIDVRERLSNKLKEDKEKLFTLTPSSSSKKEDSNSILDILSKKEAAAAPAAPAPQKQAEGIVPPWQREKSNPAPTQKNNQEATSLDDIRRMLENR